jgi:hypothetical protein
MLGRLPRLNYDCPRVLRFVLEKAQNFLFGDPVNFDSFVAAMLARKNSNSRLGPFQKEREEFDKCLVAAIFHGRRPQANLYRTFYYGNNFVLAGSWLYSY